MAATQLSRFAVATTPAGPPPPPLRASHVCLGLRDGARGTLWRGRLLSTEAIHAVQTLKAVFKRGDEAEKADVFRKWLGRLLKSDALAVLGELRRQNEVELALKVFAYIRREEWYKPDVSLYSDMIMLLGKNHLIELALKLFYELEEDGLQPDTRAYTEIIGAFLRVQEVDKAMDLYKAMKSSGCKPHELTFTILIRNLEKVGKVHLSSSVRKDCMDMLEYPEKFLKEVDKSYPKRRQMKIV